MSQRVGAERHREEQVTSAEARGEQIIAEKLARLRWEEAEPTVAAIPKMLPIAVRLRAETTLTTAKRLLVVIAAASTPGGKPGPHVPIP